jgi:hypothetical protein
MGLVDKFKSPLILGGFRLADSPPLASRYPADGRRRICDELINCNYSQYNFNMV